MTVFPSALAALLFVTAAWLVARIALGAYTTRQNTLVQCDSCHLYVTRDRLSFVGSDPVCHQCQNAMLNADLTDL